MGFRSTDQDQSSNSRQLEKVSSFGENFGAGVGLMFDEESSFSSYLGNSNVRARDAEIRKLVAEGKVSQSILDTYTNKDIGRGISVDYGKVAEYLNNDEAYEGPELKNNLTLANERNAELKSRRNYRNDIFRRAGTAGTIGQFAGSMAAGSIDPVNIAATVLTPVTSGVRGASRALYALSQAGKGAGYGALAGAAVEPFVHSWKEEIGVEYTLADSMFNIVASGVFDGTINGVAAFVTYKRVKGASQNESQQMQEVPETEVEVKTNEVEVQNRPQEEVEPNKKLTLYEQHLADVEAKNTAEPTEDFNRPMTYEEREEMIVGLRNQGLDAEEAEDLAHFVYESTTYPDQNAKTKDVFEELETRQENMEVGTPKEETEPSFGPDDLEEIDRMYESVNPELKKQFDEAEVLIDAEVERLQGKLECLNG